MVPERHRENYFCNIIVCTKKIQVSRNPNSRFAIKWALVYLYSDTLTVAISLGHNICNGEKKNLCQKVVKLIDIDKLLSSFFDTGIIS